MAKSALFREQELAFRTQYAELKERVIAAGRLLPGTPGALVRRKGTGYSYWYRVFYSVPGKQSEELVCKDGDAAALQSMRDRIAFSEWVAAQVSNLRKLGFQTADKPVARVLVELHNRGAFEAGLALVGTLGYMAWLNELGAVAVSARTLDIDLARHQQLKLAAPLSFLTTMQATGLPFAAIPGMPAKEASTSVKLPGVQGLRVDVLAPGIALGAVVRVPELDWAAQAIPHYDYLLKASEPGAMLAGGHCIPVRLPQAARLVWHKLYSSTARLGFPEKAAKDRHQALVLASVISETDPRALTLAFKATPGAMARKIRPLYSRLVKEPAAHAPLQEVLRACLRP
ncbi:MAG: hypothetical protein HY661_05685 [Betaproteobacteria bacterium]|nr:hypothetical protein [Betaproteobacteria bacterium]